MYTGSTDWSRGFPRVERRSACELWSDSISEESLRASEVEKSSPRLIVKGLKIEQHIVQLNKSIQIENIIW